MNLPSSRDIKQEILLAEDCLLETDLDEVFLSGVRRALEWTQGIGVSPTEFLKMCQRVPARH